MGKPKAPRRPLRQTKRGEQETGADQSVPNGGDDSGRAAVAQAPAPAPARANGPRISLTHDEAKERDAEEAACTPTHPGWAERPPEDTLTKWYWQDPEPGFQGMIASDRILAYHYKVGRMIRPLQLEHVKPASYEFTLGPLYVMNGEQGTLSDTKRKLRIEPNSIAFVSMREQLLLPHWLVGRFDLSINFIYQGLLLGTGPQVDPGFQGVLSCPLHNISNDRIELEFCQPFAKIDFVKTSFGRGNEVHLPDVASDVELRAASPIAGYEGQPLKVFAASKTFRPPILFAPDKEPVRVKSSVRDLSDRVKDNERLVARTRNFSVAGALAVLALLATMFAAAVGAFVYTLSYTDGRVSEVKVAPERVGDLKTTVDRLETQGDALCDRVTRLSPRQPRPPGC